MGVPKLESNRVGSAQAVGSVCRPCGACADRVERVQTVWGVCSPCGVCPDRGERVQTALSLRKPCGSCSDRFGRVQTVWGVCARSNTANNRCAGIPYMCTIITPFHRLSVESRGTLRTMGGVVAYRRLSIHRST